jgi:hypothetical protein
MEKEKKKINIKARDEELKGSYSNLMQILHTKEEFILDFFLAFPPQGILSSRIIMSPRHVKRMIKALQNNIDNYEGKFGAIEEEGSSMEGKVGFVVDNK